MSPELLIVRIHRRFAEEQPRESELLGDRVPIDQLQQKKSNQIYFYIKLYSGCKLKEIATEMNLSVATVNRILKQLKQDGLIEYVGSKKTGGYRVTE